MVKAFTMVHVECDECGWDWNGPAVGQGLWHECNKGNREFLLPNAYALKLKEKKRASY